MKKISVLIPAYNEEDNVVPISEAIVNIFETQLLEYDYEIVFIDNCSTDKTRKKLRELCHGNKRIKAIFNIRNFGQFNSPYYGMLQTTGDCTISMCCDFQDPVELIPEFVKEWENGYKIVCGVKATSKENAIVRAVRTLYYRAIKKFSDIDQIEHFTGFGLYDKSFIDTLRNLNDPTPFLRGIVAELGPEHKVIKYEQQKRRHGKTHNNIFTLYDAAMLSFTSYTKVGLRVATFAGIIIASLSFAIAIVYLIMKLIYWDNFIAGYAPNIIITCLLCGTILFFVGLLGEYIMAINIRMLNRPLVIEKERINFE